MRDRRTMAGRALALLGVGLVLTAFSPEALAQAEPETPVQASPPPRPGPPAPSSPPAPRTVADAPRPIPLPPPTDRSETSSRDGEAASPSLGGSVWSTLAALTVVIALIVTGACVARRTLPGLRMRGSPLAVQVLGRALLSPRQAVYIVRCGRRLLVLGCTPDQIRTLSEITDPEEVAELAGRCEQDRPTSMTSVFRDLFRQEAEAMEAEPPAPAPEPADSVKEELDELAGKIQRWKQLKTG